MSKRNLVFLLFAFLFLSGQAVAQGPTIFISTINGHQILSVDGTSGATTVIHTGLPTFFPEDIVVGPDGKIYICDAPRDKIWRVNQNGTQPELVYDVFFATIPNPPFGPEGPSFINNTLVFNTRGPNHSGVWKIEDIATVPSGDAKLPIVDPVNLVDAAGTGSTFGEGTDFDEIGNLLIVDRSNSTVLRASAPTFASAPVLIPNPADPASPPADLDLLIGVAVNSKNEIFVASHERGPEPTLDTSDGKIQRFDSDGNFLGTFVSFTGADAPQFMEFDASDNLFVVTTQDGFGRRGKVWRIGPSPGPSPGMKTLLVDLDLAFGTIPLPTPSDLASNFALGLAVPPTSTSITKSFTPGITGITSQNFNFGTHSFSITFDEVRNPFDLIVTAEDVLPADVVLLGGVPPVQYAFNGGFVKVYVVSGDPRPIPGTDYADTDPDGGILIYIGYFTAGIDAGISGRIRGFSRLVVGDTRPPTLLHDPSGGGDDFSEDVTVAFFPMGTPVDDGDNFFCGFLQPFRDGSTLVKSGRTLPLRFKVSTSESCLSDFNPHVVAWLRVEKLLDVPIGTSELVLAESSGKANTDVFFRFDSGSGTYKYNLSLKGFSEGTFRLTVFSNVFSPQMVLFSVGK